MITETPLVLERLISAPRALVWQAITDPACMKQWYFDLPGFEARVGYTFSFWGGPPEKQYHHLCRVTEVTEGSKLSYTWVYEGYAGESEVTFELMDRDDKTLVRLTHRGLHTFPASNPDLARTNFEAGWNDFIGNRLPHYVEHLSL